MTYLFFGSVCQIQLELNLMLHKSVFNVYKITTRPAESVKIIIYENN